MSGLFRLGLVFGLLALAAPVPLRADDHFVDYDTDFNFSTLKTFTIGMGAIASDAPELDNPITRKGIANSIRSKLLAKKLVESTTLPTDLVVNWSVGAEPERGSRAVTPGRPRRVPFTYTKGTIVITMTTSQSQLVWHGTYRDDEPNPSKIAEQLPKHVAKLLDEFPPRK